MFLIPLPLLVPWLLPCDVLALSLEALFGQWNGEAVMACQSYTEVLGGFVLLLTSWQHVLVAPGVLWLWPHHSSLCFCFHMASSSLSDVFRAHPNLNYICKGHTLRFLVDVNMGIPIQPSTLCSLLCSQGVPMLMNAPLVSSPQFLCKSQLLPLASSLTSRELRSEHTTHLANPESAQAPYPSLPTKFIGFSGSHTLTHRPLQLVGTAPVFLAFC